MRLDSPKMNIIRRACLKAAKSLIRDFGELEKLQVSSKNPGDFVSAADKKSEKIIIEELLKVNPNCGILSEETGELNKKNKEERWIIDPIDGTVNFLNGIPHFAISVGYEENGEIKCGIIFDPIKDEMFFAEKGLGAFLNNTRIRVSKQKKLTDSIIATGGPKFNSEQKNFILKEYLKVSNIVHAPIRKFGSAALDIANVACGRFDGFWQRELKYWDVAAGIIILKEAGGFIDFIDNNEKNLIKKNIIATNSNIHEELLACISKKNIE